MNAEREGTAQAASEAAKDDFGGSTGVRAKLPREGSTYRDLVETLLSVRANPHQPHPVARHVCAVLSAWAHADAETAQAVFARLGLPENQCTRIEVENGALALSGSLLLVQSKCRRVALVAYRGLDPYAPASWSLLGDAQPSLVPVPPAGAEARVSAVHYRNQRASWSGLIEALEAATKTKNPKQRGKNDKDGLEALFLTGHGSAGASAALAAYRLVTSAQPEVKRVAERLAQVYTFAAPMFGNAPFARSWNEQAALVDRVFCHSFGRDPMPHLPPRGTQTFRHVGKHYAASSGSPWPEEPGVEPKPVTSPFDVVRALAPLLAEQAALPSFDRRGWFGAKSISALAGLLFKDGPTYSFYDHTPMNYVVSSQPKGVLSEFGEHF
jgi:Lipase (class 3)